MDGRSYGAAVTAKHFMMLLDTSVLIDIDDVRLPEGSLQLSAISLSELTFGIEKTSDVRVRRLRVRRLARIEELVPAAWLPFDERAAQGTGFLSAIVSRSRAAHARSKDIMLAGHAFALGAALITFNPKDFELLSGHVEIIVPELRR